MKSFFLHETFDKNWILTKNLICNPHCTPGRHWQSPPSLTQWYMRNPYMAFNNLWREREKCWNLSQAHFYFLYLYFTCPAILLWLIDPAIWVTCPVTGSLWKCEQKCESCCYHTCFFCPPLHYSGRGASREADCDACKENCVSVCVCAFSAICAKKSWGFLSRRLGSSFPPTCSNQALDHKSSSLALINMNIIFYYPSPLTLMMP